MYAKIIKYLLAHPNGSRLREMMSPLGLTRAELVSALSTLEHNGTIYSVDAGDRANMEFYYLWFVRKKS